VNGVYVHPVVQSAESLASSPPTPIHIVRPASESENGSAALAVQLPSRPEEPHEILPGDTRTSPTRRESDYMAVRPYKNITHVSTSGETRSGYINGQRGEGRIDPDLNLNIISQSYVDKYRLQIESLDPGQELDFHFGLGRRGKCLGKVDFTWTRDRSFYSQDITVHCFVCENAPSSLVVPVDLVLGKAFLDKERELSGTDG